jgi:hypothetical protein
MRTYKDAKSMAKSLRKSLTANNVALSHSECLEIVARVTGFADWNTLSANLDVEKSCELAPPEGRSESRPAALSAACEVPQNSRPKQACSFCGKCKVRSLIEGECSRDPGAPRRCVFICDECVALCAQVNAEFIGNIPA